MIPQEEKRIEREIKREQRQQRQLPKQPKDEGKKAAPTPALEPAITVSIGEKSEIELPTTYSRRGVLENAPKSE